MESKYWYTGTKVLINKLNIKEQTELDKAERTLVSLRIAELEEKPIKGNFDLEHMCKIHLHLFQDVYKWAGQTRDCILHKNKVLFCLPGCIHIYARTILEPIQKERFYLSYDPEERIKKIAVLFTDTNTIHPFREGNGRTQ